MSPTWEAMTDIRHVFNRERSVRLRFEKEYSEEQRGFVNLPEDINEMFREGFENVFAKAHEYPVLANSSTLPLEKQVEGISEMNDSSFDICVAPPTKICLKGPSPIILGMTSEKIVNNSIHVHDEERDRECRHIVYKRLEDIGLEKYNETTKDVRHPVVENSTMGRLGETIRKANEIDDEFIEHVDIEPKYILKNNKLEIIYPKTVSEEESSENKSQVGEKFEWELPGYFEKLVDDIINNKIEESSHRTKMKIDKTNLKILAESIDFMKLNECKPGIKMGFLYNHRIQPLARAGLVEYLIQLHIDHNFPPSVLPRCVSYFDRYLQANKNISTCKLVAVGTIAMIMAARFETTCYVDVDKLITSCEALYSQDEIQQIEAKIMEGLHFNRLIPTSMCFLKVYNTFCSDTVDHEHMSNYFLEIMLVDYGISHVRPSLQAAAAFCLSKEILSGIEFFPYIWTPNLMEITKYSYEDFASVVKKLAQILLKSEFYEKQKIIKMKYSSVKYNKISLHHELNEGNMRTIAATRRGFRKSPLF